jgi:thymidylate synthase (FAD)
MSVKLISITPNAEEIIIFCARVSSNQDNKDLNLIKYLIKHKHYSPFEMANMIIEIECPRYITQQILRHRSFSFQEFSQRYKTININKFVDPEFRTKNNSNRQSSTEINKKNEEFKEKTKELFKNINDLYNEMLINDIAPECARIILPLNTLTKIYMNGNIRSWLTYLDVRCHESTQKEHRDIALKIKDIFKEQLPFIYNSYFNN